jgi:hypothetical protein
MPSASPFARSGSNVVHWSRITAPAVLVVTVSCLAMPMTTALASEHSSQNSPTAAPSHPADTQPARPSALESNLSSIEKLLADLKRTSASGATAAAQEGRPDSRMSILALLLEKLEPTIQKRANRQVRDSALEQAKAARNLLVKEIVPAYSKAKGSRDPDDIKAIVPQIEKLQGRIASLRAMLAKDSSLAVSMRSATDAQSASGQAGASTSASQPSEHAQSPQVPVAPAGRSH